MPNCGCGGRYFCRHGNELIHRDHRQAWESASAFGQIVWRVGPSILTTGDIDHYSVVFGMLDLLRIIEHKQPDQELKTMQKKVLLLLGKIINHCITCKMFVNDHDLDPRSGVFLLRGHIAAEKEGQKKTFFDGETKVLRADGNEFKKTGILADKEAIFRWLEGTQGTNKPSGPRRKNNLPQVI